MHIQLKYNILPIEAIVCNDFLHFNAEYSIVHKYIHHVDKYLVQHFNCSARLDYNPFLSISTQPQVTILMFSLFFYLLFN